MIEWKGKVGGVAGVLSELPAVEVLRGLRWRSGGLGLVRVMRERLPQQRGTLVGYSAEPGALGAGTVGGVVGFHRGHGRGQRTGIGPGCTAQILQRGL